MGIGHILGEGAAIFTDMTETMLTALDKQMALSDTAQKPEDSSLSKFLTHRQTSSHSKIRSRESRSIPVSAIKEEDKYLTYIYLSLRIIRSATCSAGMQIVCQQIITPWY